MSRGEDRKILDWVWQSKDYVDLIPNYTTSDSDAITLLPVLVEKGYHYLLRNEGIDYIEFAVWTDPDSAQETGAEKTTIADSITTTILRLIEKEAEK